MDQAAPADQEVFRHLAQRGQDADLGGHLGLCACGDHQKAVASGPQPLHNPTVSQRPPVRKSHSAGSTYKLYLQ